MNSGIYVLEFPNEVFYIGKSDNIPRRWEEHKKSFLKGSHAKKMQWAYDSYGMPEFRVHIECHRDHIDLLESICIHANADAGHSLLNGNKPSPVPADEITILMASGDELKLSTAEHIRMLKRLENIAEQYKELKDTGIYLPEEVEDMPMRIDELERENKWLLEDLQAVRHKLTKLRNRGLWDRIFNNE